MNPRLTTGTSQPLSARSRKSSISKRRPSSACPFCRPHQPKRSIGYLSQMVNKALYTKYSSSQNYYYTKTINDIIGNSRLPIVIFYKDLQFYDDDEEYLKRFYRSYEYANKIKMLSEYYKYHEDIPRLFMVPTTNTLNRYHDKKRRLDYLKITKMLKEQNQPKSGGGAVLKTERSESLKPDFIPITNRILTDLELSQVSNCKSIDDDDMYKPRTAGLFKVNKKAVLEKGKITKTEKENKRHQRFDSNPPLVSTNAGTLEQPQESSLSLTIKDLNMKLGEIINQSYSNFEASEYQSNKTISNLDNFLRYMQGSNNPATRLMTNPDLEPDQPRLRKSAVAAAAIVGGAGVGAGSGSGGVGAGTGAGTRIVKNEPRAESRERVRLTERNEQPKMELNIRFAKEGNLADKLLKEVPADFFRKKPQRTAPTEENLETEPQLPGQISGRHSARLSTATGTTRPKNVPITVIKIQNFEDALKIRQGSPLKTDIQRAGSREKLRPPSAISARALDSRNTKRQENKAQDILAFRRRSQASNDFTAENSTKLSFRNKSIYNLKELGITDKIPESARLRTQTQTQIQQHQQHQQLTERPNSSRQMRISLDMNALVKHSSQPGTVTNSNPTAKAANYSNNNNNHVNSNFTKIPNTATNSGERTKPQKGIPLHMGSLTSREIKQLTGLGLAELRTQDLRSIPSSTNKTRSIPRAQSQVQDGLHPITIIPEQEIVNLKQHVEKITRRSTPNQNITPHHKHTKSEERLTAPGLISFGRKNSMARPTEVYREMNQSPYEGTRTKSSGRPRMYTYNHNNIVNIYVSNAQEKNPSEPSSVMRGEVRRTGSMTERELLSSGKKGTPNPRTSVPDIFAKMNGKNEPGRRIETYDNYRTRENGRETPQKRTEPDEIRISKARVGGYPTGSMPSSIKATKKRPEINFMEKGSQSGVAGGGGGGGAYEVLLTIKNKN